MSVVRTFFSVYAGTVVVAWLIVFDWVLRITHEDCVRPMVRLLRTRRGGSGAAAEELG